MLRTFLACQTNEQLFPALVHVGDMSNFLVAGNYKGQQFIESNTRQVSNCIIASQF